MPENGCHEIDGGNDVKRVKVFKALRNNVCRAWHLEEEPIRIFLQQQQTKLAEDDQEPTYDWKLEVNEEDVYEAVGIVHDWNESDEGPRSLHVHWRCPICNLEQSTDIEQEIKPPQLWMCGTPGCPTNIYTIVTW